MLNYRAIASVMACASLAVGGTLVAQPAEAASKKINLGTIFFDTPGNDLPASNAKVNREYVQIKNISKSSISLKDWTLKDKAGHMYRFGEVTLEGGDYLRVYSGKGTDNAHKLYWGRSYYIWNNDGDTAYLRNPDNAGGDTCSWTADTKGNYINC